MQKKTDPLVLRAALHWVTVLAKERDPERRREIKHVIYAHWEHLSPADAAMVGRLVLEILDDESGV